MRKISTYPYVLFFLAFLIPFLYFLNLNWYADSAINSYETMDVYFGADVARVVDNLEDNGKIPHYRDRTHPYFSILAVSVSKIGVYLGYQNLAFPIYKLIFGTLGCFLFWVFIFKKTNSVQAFVSLALLMSCMSFRVWTAIPETFLFSFFTLMVALNLMLLKAKPEFTLLATLAGTITNLVLGLIHLILVFKNRNLIIKIMLSFSLIAITTSIIQQSIYPTSAYFFDFLGQKEELGYVTRNLSTTTFRLFDFFVSGFIIPLNKEITLPVSTAKLWQSFYIEELFSFKLMTYLTVIIIVILISSYLISLYAFYKQKTKDAINQSILIFLGFELVLHLFYGDSPFLYSLNFTPLIIIFMSINQPEKLKSAMPYVFVFLAFLIQKFNFMDPSLFTKYFF